MVDTVLRKMLIERDVENAKAYTRTKISELLQVGFTQRIFTFMDCSARACILNVCLVELVLQSTLAVEFFTEQD